MVDMAVLAFGGRNTFLSAVPMGETGEMVVV